MDVIDGLEIVRSVIFVMLGRNGRSGIFRLYFMRRGGKNEEVCEVNVGEV